MAGLTYLSAQLFIRAAIVREFHAIWALAAGVRLQLARYVQPVLF